MGGCLRQICEKPYCSRAVRPKNLTVRTKFSTDLAENLTARHFGGPKIYRYNKISVFARFSKTLNKNVRKTKGIQKRKRNKNFWGVQNRQNRPNIQNLWLNF